MKKNKLAIGQKLWAVLPSYRNEVIEPKEVTVTKVGNKYFEVAEFQYRKFSIETLGEAIKSNYRTQIYLTLQEIKDKREFDSLSISIKKSFPSFGELPYTLDQLRKINAIMQNEEDIEKQILVAIIKEVLSHTQFRLHSIVANDINEKDRVSLYIEQFTLYLKPDYHEVISFDKKLAQKIADTLDIEYEQ